MRSAHFMGVFVGCYGVTVAIMGCGNRGFVEIADLGQKLGIWAIIPSVFGENGRFLVKSNGSPKAPKVFAVTSVILDFRALILLNFLMKPPKF